MDLYGILGFPAKHSLSPLIHNAAFKALGIDAEYRIFEVSPNNLQDFLENEIHRKCIKGLSVTIPHKLECMKYLDKIKETARQLGAVNTIKNDNGKLIGENYDWVGVYKPIKDNIDLENKKIVMCGAGGAARAAAFAVTREKIASLTVLVRNPSQKHKTFSQKFSCKIDSIQNIHNYEADIIINATQVGMKSESDPESIKESLFPKDYLKPHMLVFEVIYAPLETQLIRNAKQVGCKTITGDQMLLYQAYEQFKFWTGHPAPKQVMQSALTKKLSCTSSPL